MAERPSDNDLEKRSSRNASANAGLRTEKVAHIDCG